MAEEKNKKNTTTKKTNNAKKTTTTKKVNTQNNKKKPVKKTTQGAKQQPKKQVKKVTPKKTETKKVAPKKVEETKIKKVTLTAPASSISNPDPEPTPVPVVTEEIEKVIEIEIDNDEGESLLERTLIFDGRENQNLAEVVQKLEEENVVLEDKIIKRSKGKKTAVMVLTALIFVVILATIIYVINSEITRVTNNQTLNSNIYDKVSHNYSSINDINTEKKTDSALTNEEYKNIEDITLGQFEKKILEKEDMIVLVSSTTCYYCIDYEPIVNEVFEGLEKNIYRINIIALDKEEKERFRTYYAFKKAPTIFTIKNGVVKNELVGKKEKKELLDWVNHNM